MNVILDQKKTASILDVAQGALGEEINYQLTKVAENLADPNTDCKAKRSVILELSFTQDENRQVVTMSGQVKTKLASSVPIISTMAFGKDNDGNMQAVELVSNPGQIDIFGNVAPEGKVVPLSK